MTHKTVGIHTDQSSDYGKDLEQKRDNGENPLQETVREAKNCYLKMRRTHYQEGKASCPICHTLFTKKRPWHQFCSTPCRRKHHRRETRDAILIGMVSTARALNYTRDEFISKISSMWE